MTVTGKIKLIRDTQTFDSGFQKREFVVTTLEQYPQDISIDFIKDKCSLLDMYKIDDSVEVSTNLRGSEYNGRYFVNLQAWKIEKSLESTQQPVENKADKKEEEDTPF